MNILVVLVPMSLLLGGLGLFAFIWSLRANQYEDLAGDAARVLLAENIEQNPRGKEDEIR